jgi:aspartate kinase
MLQAVEIIAAERGRWSGVAVVTSALSGVTDLLINSAVQAAGGEAGLVEAAVRELETRHHDLIDVLVPGGFRKRRVHREVNALITDFANLCRAIYVLGEATPRALDAVAGLGERLSVRILAAAAEARSIPAQYVDATRLIVTDDRYQNAVPDMQATARQTCQVLDPVLAAGTVPVVTGFIAATPQGIATTLGRGGSDYSAAILAVALQAAELWIWTDVDGVMTADPRLVADAHTIPVLSYREVAEMAHFGAKVLHPKSIHPVIAGGIALRVCNTFNPANPGTRLVADRDSNGLGAIKAVTAIRGLRLVTISGTGMLGVPGVAGRIFSAAATTGISVPLIIESTSEQAICFPAPRERVPEVVCSLQERLSQELQRGDIDRIFASEDVDILTVICPGLRTTPGIAGKIFTTLGDAGINVLGISFGASDVSINLIVSADDSQPALRAIHSLIH